MSSLIEPLASDLFVLRSSTTSPFGRKVRMASEVLGLEHRVSLQMASTVDESDTIRQQNPLGKIPCLLLADGTTIFDSRTIIEFLCSMVPYQTLFPHHPLALAKERTSAVLADGIADAALLMVYEGRFRAPEQRSDIWLSHQRGKIMRALAHFETDAPRLHPALTMAGISLSCALGYLDWRQPVAWREDFPRLVAWLDEFETHFPALAAMHPTETTGEAR